MRRSFIFILSVVIAVSSLLAANYDYIMLSNGSVVKGRIVTEEPNVSVTIRAENGSLYTYDFTQIRKITRNAPVVPTATHDSNLGVLSEMENGFWFAVEAGAGVSCRFSKSNRAFGEGDIVFGYRFNQYAKAGVGVGFRYYFNAYPEFRSTAIDGSFPVYFNLRGNLLGDMYRSVVPYYNIDVGAAIRDGAMIRPGIGLRMGQRRSAFLLGISYLAQQLPQLVATDGGVTRERKWMSFACVKIGYEF